MLLLIGKLYQSYKRQGDPNAEMKITGYFAMVLYFATWCIILPLFEIIKVTFFGVNLKPHRVIWVISSFVLFYLFYRLVYKYLFAKKHMTSLEKRYKNYHIPTFLLYLVVVLIPVLLLLLGPTLAVLLTGGEILGNRITGVFE
ncbi:MAG: hypothetical protein EOO07_34685 [Chitinophagaceae bacterium]|nr:MAG: hypothetical protein EOO07_34685 [Chitinophagaceae bacterium]